MVTRESSKGFYKGHPYYPARQSLKGRAGRKKTPVGKLKDALQQLSDDLPELIHIYTEVARDGKHADLFMYLADRVLGKAKVTTELNMELSVTADQCYMLLEKLKQQEKAFVQGIVDIPALPPGSQGVENQISYMLT